MRDFKKIAKGELTAKVIWEDKNFLAFLDTDPVNKWHTIVIPRKEIGWDLFESEESDYRNLMLAVQKVAKYLRRQTKSERVVMWVEGYDANHPHVHLLPTRRDYEFQIEDRKYNPSREELRNIQGQIAKK